MVICEENIEQSNSKVLQLSQLQDHGSKEKKKKRKKFTTIPLLYDFHGKEEPIIVSAVDVFIFIKC